RTADQRDAVVVSQIEHPVMALAQAGEKIAEPVVEAHPELVGAARLLRHRLAPGFLPLAACRFAAVDHLDATLVLQPVTRLGAHAVALEEHRQPRLFVPGALIALQIDVTYRPWRIDGVGAGAPGQQ